MDAPESAALRHLLDRYLAGDEPLDAVVPRFAALLGRFLEADLRATEAGSSPLADFEPPLVTEDQRRRMQELGQALVEYYPPSPIEYLPHDDPGGGAA